MINDQADADDFIVMFADGTTEKDIAKFCNGQCRLFGNAWASVSGRTNVEQMLQLRAGVGIDFVEPYGARQRERRARLHPRHWHPRFAQ